LTLALANARILFNTSRLADNTGQAMAEEPSAHLVARAGATAIMVDTWLSSTTMAPSMSFGSIQ
jgi:hypothetical protein